jgi:hypothetical protein
MSPQQVGDQMRQHGDLIVAADAGDHRGDVRVGERSVDVGRPVRRAGPQPARRRVLDRDQAELIAEPR